MIGIKIDATEGGTFHLTVSEDGDVSFGITNDKGHHAVRFCTVIGGETRPAQKAFYRIARGFIPAAQGAMCEAIQSEEDAHPYLAQEAPE